MKNGTLRSDGLVLAKLTVDWLHPSPQVQPTTALVSSKDGMTLAWLVQGAVPWSKDTTAALARLRDCIEADLAKAVFSAGEKEETTVVDGKAPPGIGEALNNQDNTPQV